MRQERIIRQPRRRKPAPEQTAPVLAVRPADTSAADEVITHIDDVLEAA
jgi:hypothetical protein